MSEPDKNETRLNELLEILLRYTVMDFSRAAPVSEKGDEIDAIAAGLNALSEELTILMDAQKKYNEDMQHTINQLDLANKELDAFSYSVSHDLRAPLRAIHGFTKIISERYKEKVDAEGQHMMDSVMFNAKKMGQLIDDLLSFSRVGKKELQLTSLDMNKISEFVISEMKSSDPDFKTEIFIHPMPPAIADHALVGQVYSNLLSNAVKYSSKKGIPRVEIGSFIRNNEIIYYVKDNGAGFDMRYYSKLFGVFQRLHGASEFDGNGVGLALVKRIITRHGGRVWGEGETDKGATFYFTFSKKEESRKIAEA